LGFLAPPTFGSLRLSMPSQKTLLEKSAAVHVLFDGRLTLSHQAIFSGSDVSWNSQPVGPAPNHLSLMGISPSAS
jgi:hypothetical protein